MLKRNVSEVIQLQRDFFASQRTKALDFRIEMLKKLQSAVDAYEERLTGAIYDDLRKPSFEVWISELGMVRTELSTHLKHLRAWVKPERVKTPLTLYISSSYIYKEPYGVALIIAPWNYPFCLLIMPLIGAISAGNCVVLKPSNHAPNTAAVIEEMITKTFDEAYISLFQGGREMNQVLLKEKFDYIFFSGNPPLGKIVMETASKNLTPVTLELGGKSPCIVDREAKIERAARRITWGKFMNAGQTCIAPDYVLVEKSVKKDLIESLQRCITDFFGQNPELSPDFCRIVNDRHFTRLQRLMKKGRIVFGGQVNKATRYIAPTIIDNVTPDDPIMQEEIFGPLLPVLEYESIEDAISFINSRPKPLSLYIFSENPEKQKKVLAQTSSGGGCINDTVVHFANLNLPFGGAGNSGMGVYHGKASFDTFSHRKSILKKSNFLDLKLRYPPYEGKLRKLKRVLK